jgi:hypothetical protein
LAKEAVDQIEDCKSCAIQTSLQSEDHKAGCEICNTVAEELEECKKDLASKTEIIKILLEELAQAKADMNKCQHKIYEHNLTTTSRIASSEGTQWQNIRYRNSKIVGKEKKRPLTSNGIPATFNRFELLDEESEDSRNVEMKERTSEGKPYHEEIPTRIERIKGKEDTWIQVNTGRHKISRRPEIKCAQPVLRSVNQYELPDNLNELMNVSQNWRQESNKGIEDRKRGTRKKHKVLSSGTAMLEGVRQK